MKSHAHISCIQTLSFSSFLFLVLVLFLSLSFVVDRERSKCGSERKCGRVVNKRERKDLGLREREGGADKDFEGERCVSKFLCCKQHLVFVGFKVSFSL